MKLKVQFCLSGTFNEKYLSQAKDSVVLFVDIIRLNKLVRLESGKQGEAETVNVNISINYTLSILNYNKNCNL